MNKKVREAVMERAANRCECCGRPMFDTLKDRATLDHAFGRPPRAPEDVEHCWALRAECHELKTASVPSKGVWLLRFLGHCRKHRLFDAAERAQKELEYHEARRRALVALGQLKPLDSHNAKQELSSCPSCQHTQGRHLQSCPRAPWR